MDELTRAIEQLTRRLSGPMHIRLWIQPAVAITLAVRAGLRDARENKPAYLWELLTNPANRRQMLHSAWKDLARLIIFCFLIDSAYQFFVLKFYYPLQALIVVLVLTVIPYIMVRGPITRLRRRLGPSLKIEDQKRQGRT